MTAAGAATTPYAEHAAVLRLEQRLVVVTQWLAAAGIPSLVLKGAALAHLDHPDPADRVYGDVDLLLRSEDLVAATRVLADRGYQRRQLALRPSSDQRFIKSITMVAPDGVELDLHRTLADGTYGLRLDPDALWEDTEEFTLAGRTLRAPDREHRLIHACLHAVLAIDPPDRSVRDVAVLLAHPDIDHDEVARRVTAWELDAVVSRAIGLVAARLGAHPQNATAARFANHPERRRDRWAIAAYTDPDRGHLAKVLASLPFLAGWRDRARFLVASAVPSREFLRAHGGLTSWWSRGRRAFVKLVRAT